jgi:hypothetical protein
MEECNQFTQFEQSACYGCLTEAQLDWVVTYLLCQWANEED